MNEPEATVVRKILLSREPVLFWVTLRCARVKTRGTEVRLQDAHYEQMGDPGMSQGQSTSLLYPGCCLDGLYDAK